MSRVRLPFVIGFSGRKRSGKDTAADAANHLLTNAGFTVRRMAFADRLKDLVCEFYGFTRDEVEGVGFDREAVLPQYGRSLRVILQETGMYFRENVGKDVWVSRLARDWEASEGFDFALVTDVRFQNEAKWVSENGVLVRVDRDFPENYIMDNHASETMDLSAYVKYVLKSEPVLSDVRLRVQDLLTSMEGEPGFPACGCVGRQLSFLEEDRLVLDT